MSLTGALMRALKDTLPRTPFLEPWWITGAEIDFPPVLKKRHVAMRTNHGEDSIADVGERRAVFAESGLPAIGQRPDPRAAHQP